MKKIAILMALFILTSTLLCQGALFSDTEGHWAESYINTLATEGVISGMGEGIFAPDSMVTREQFLKMLLIATAKSTDERLAFENPPKLNLIIEKSPFSDVSTDRWSYYYVREAEGSIILKEDFGEKFEPVCDITREEAAVWMARALNLESGVCNFTDAEAIGNKDLVGAAAEKGLITGFPDGRFGPKEGLTRAQAAVMLKRAAALNIKLLSEIYTKEAKNIERDLNSDGKNDIVKILTDGEGYVLTVNDVGAVGGFSTLEETKYYLIDIDKNDKFLEVAVAESYYGSGALAIYRYTGESLYLMGYIESVGGVTLRTDNTPIGDDWGAISVNDNGTLTCNIGEQFVHTMLLRKQYGINEKNRLVPLSTEFNTLGNYSEFTVINNLDSPMEDAEHPAISLTEGYVGKIVKTDLSNWIYIETGSGDAGWIYVHDDGLIDGEPLSYYLEGLHFAG